MMTLEQKKERNRKISEVKTAKNIAIGSMVHFPETWKLPCSGCGAEITFEKYHRFQNAKSGVKRGHDLFCSECKEQNKLAKRNPLLDIEWKIECHDEECKTIIEYENYPAFKRALERIERGEPKYCKECRKEKHPKKNGPKRMYSNNSEDWKIKCKFDDCEKILIYNSYGAWCAISKRIKDGNPPMCYSCAAKNWERTEEYKEKLRGRKHTEETKQKFKETCENRSPERKQEISETHSKIRKETWNNYTAEQYEWRKNICAKNLNDLTDEQRIERSKLLSYYAKKRHNEQFKNGKWQPFYNKSTIPYIVDILNVRYDTEFQHAETEMREFRIFDELFETHYFADAYCPKLNLWIEFDEPHHFKKGVLREECQIRENRIREILPEVTIHRIYFDKKNHN